jgi:hypothetical protein
MNDRKINYYYLYFDSNGRCAISTVEAKDQNELNIALGRANVYRESGEACRFKDDINGVLFNQKTTISNQDFAKKYPNRS